MSCLMRIVLVACAVGYGTAYSAIRHKDVAANGNTDKIMHPSQAVRRGRINSQAWSVSAAGADDVNSQSDADVAPALMAGGYAVNNSLAMSANWQNPGMELVLDAPLKMYAAYYSNPSHRLVEISAVPNPTFFYMKTAGVVVAAFACMYLYSLWSDVIAERTGLKLSHVCCIIYASLSISIDLSIKNAAEAYGGSFPFNPACGVVVVEYAKLIVSAILLAYHLCELRARGEAFQTPTLKDVACLAVPGAIYAMNNLIVFQAIKSTPLSTFGVIRETMLIWNALIWTATFRQQISATRWLAIGGIFFGCSINQIPKMLNDEFTFGVFWACLLAFTNAAGAVANEYAMKQKAQLDINLQNSILYFLCGTFVLAGIAVFSGEHVQSANAFFTGFVPECWTIIVLQVFTGLAVSRILKYVEAVTKTIVAAIRGPGVIFLGALIFHKQLHGSEVFATLCVCTACWVYLREGPLTQPKAQAAAEASK